MTLKDAQTLAGDYFNDLAEGSPEAAHAWGAFAGNIGAPSKAYFMLTMWPFFVGAGPGPGFSVPYVSPKSSAYYLTENTANQTQTQQGYLWYIQSDWSVGRPPDGRVIGLLKPLVPVFDGWLLSGDLYAFSQGLEYLSSPQPNGSLQMIVIIPGNFPCTAVTQLTVFTPFP